MGCASSSPLVESGKNLVDTAKSNAEDVLAKGEHTLQDAGETVIEKVSTEMGHAKEVVHSTMHTMESSFNSAIGKSASVASSAKEEAVAETEEVLDVAADQAAEVVSQAETVLASEADAVEKELENVAEVWHLPEEKKVEEDELRVEDVDGLGDSVATPEAQVEELVAKLASPEKEPKKEEPPPTFWEAAADAILQQRSLTAFKENLGPALHKEPFNVHVSPPDELMVQLEEDIVKNVPKELNAELI